MNSEKTPECVVPATLDGWACLHDLYQVRWTQLHKLSAIEKSALFAETKTFLQSITSPAKGHSGYFSMLGHKADLMFLHFRETFDDLNEVELALRQQPIFEYLSPTTSYVSIVELGMYAMTQKIFDELIAQNLKIDSDAWNAAWDERMQDQFNRMKGRVFTDIPSDRYICFYPMDKRRGEKYNWYAEPMKDRTQMMFEHGMVGRKYAGKVQQIITGSIGFDDWEWGVDLFAKDPKVFKDLIYEMRFDRASAHYAEFGPFYTGLQFLADEIEPFLQGKLPK
ncbi:MAG: heme-dependent peroxidase [Deltaproteobacteria bacterium]|nr:heme-dependent peroxidase [Deltaproteobacteria bacterium]